MEDTAESEQIVGINLGVARQEVQAANAILDESVDLIENWVCSFKEALTGSP